jgi:hypothetical protein
MQPRILLVTTCRWFATARLAIAFRDVGCHIEVVCPRQHPASKTPAVRKLHTYRGLAPTQSIRTALIASRPDLVVPCDDFATKCLHQVYDDARVSGETAIESLLERSLGNPAGFATVRSRAATMALARELGVNVPETAVIQSADALTQWTTRYGLPVVLKADGTSGGRGVHVGTSTADALEALQRLGAPPPATRAIKRAVVNRDTNFLLPFLRRSHSVVNAQRFVAGRDANITIACWKGQVLASIPVSVEKTLDPNGPASVVRLVENSEMLEAVTRIVSALRLSGLAGFDFLIDEQTQAAYLIDVNPRATQIGHLSLGPGRDLPAALRAAVTGESVRERPAVTTSDLIAFFPQEWMRDSGSSLLRSAHHDVPWDEPSLLQAGLSEPLVLAAWNDLSRRIGAVRAWLGGRPVAREWAASAHQAGPPKPR